MFGFSLRRFLKALFKKKEVSRFVVIQCEILTMNRPEDAIYLEESAKLSHQAGEINGDELDILMDDLRERVEILERRGSPIPRGRDIYEFQGYLIVKDLELSEATEKCWNIMEINSDQRAVDVSFSFEDAVAYVNSLIDGLY